MAGENDGSASGLLLPAPGPLPLGVDNILLSTEHTKLGSFMDQTTVPAAPQGNMEAASGHHGD